MQRRKFLLTILAVIFLYYLGTFFIFILNIPFIQLENDLKKQVGENKKDWNDYKAMFLEQQRIGLGEQGKKATLKAIVDPAIYEKFGHNTVLSDAISVNRSVPELPDKNCYLKKYLSKLPQISVIIPFHDEYLSILLRTVHSIVNRTPQELLKEIILVDDFSQYENFGPRLNLYISAHFDKVKIIRLPERMGLIRARLAGIRSATAEVLVILDSHMEVTRNWLPPLLEPIVLNKRTVVCPIVDIISYSNFAYSFIENKRGAFDWSLRYVDMEILPEDRMDKTKPYKIPLMIGGAFAIATEFFWQLGGYDEDLVFWGGEQFDLSFKIWMCGGDGAQLLNVPCSRVGHMYRHPNFKNQNQHGNDTNIFKNYKRIAEVWMDEYKTYIYERLPEVYAKIDAGDLNKQKALRVKLQCKSFKWYMEQIAFDILKKYPPVEPPEYAYGAIQSVAAPDLCIDAFNKRLESSPEARTCASDLKNPQKSQMFALSYRRDIRRRRTYTCLDVVTHERKNAPVILYTCHGLGGNQFWYYNRLNKWLVHGSDKDSNYCLELSAQNKSEIYVNVCQKDNLYMKWNFGVVNDTALDNFFININ